MGALVLLAVVVGSAFLYKGLAPALTPAPPPAAPPPPRPPLVAAGSIEEAAPEDHELAAARVRAESRDMEERHRAVEAALGKVPVVVYSTKWCELCRTAKAWMTEKKIAFEEHDVEEDGESLAVMRKLNPDSSVPTIVVGDEVLKGFGEGAVRGAMYRAAVKRAR
jgi:glutaredoxin